MRIYLDNAATSYPKPESVYAAVDRYQRDLGVAIGRGSSRDAVQGKRIVDRCRQRIAQLLGGTSPDHVILTSNGTDSLNLALHGLCRPGDHVVTTTLEHNSVLRPLRWLQDHRGVTVTRLEPGPSGAIDPCQVREALRPQTRLLAIQHVSNVTGRVQPIADLCAVARAAGVLTLVDAAQSAGHIPVKMSEWSVDLLACPGHKGLLGPLGTGVLILRPGLEEHLEPVRQGGTGSQSEDDHQPDTLPDRYESGNHNGPGLAGLAEGVAWVIEKTVEVLEATERQQVQELVARLRAIPGLTVYGHEPDARSTGVVSVNLEGYAPHEVASILDESFGIQVRAGLHCAPGAHAFLKTRERGGTVRLSLGPWISTTELAAVADAFRGMAGG